MGHDVISPTLMQRLAQARVNDLRRAADAYRRAHPDHTVAHGLSLTLRFGSPADQERLAQLAALDGSTPPAQPVLLAEVDGKLLAALGLCDGTAVADPFHRTADLIDLLRARARHLDGTPRMRRAGRLSAWLRLRRLAWR